MSALQALHAQDEGQRLDRAAAAAVDAQQHLVVGQQARVGADRHDHLPAQVQAVTGEQAVQAPGHLDHGALRLQLEVVGLVELRAVAPACLGRHAGHVGLLHGSLGAVLPRVVLGQADVRADAEAVLARLVAVVAQAAQHPLDHGDAAVAAAAGQEHG